MTVAAPSSLRSAGSGADAYRTRDDASKRLFRYTPAQRFVAYRLVHGGEASGTNTNGRGGTGQLRAMLAWHGIGTGKTCTGIQTATAFLRKYPTGCVHVIAPTRAILSNWETAFYNPTKPLAEQCANSSALAPVYFTKGGVSNNNRVRIYSLESFQAHFTPMMLQTRTATHLANLDITASEYSDLPDNLNRLPFRGHHLFIVDEIHMRGFIPKDGCGVKFLPVKRNKRKVPADWQWASGTMSYVQQKARDYLQRAVPGKNHDFRFPVSFILGIIGQRCKNTRMLLLTATPAYDNMRRVYGIISLLRAFHRIRTPAGRHGLTLRVREEEERERQIHKPILKHDGKTWLLDNKKLLHAARGYVSYVRGEDPYHFPVRLPPLGKKEETCRTDVSDAQFKHIRSRPAGRWETASKAIYFTSSCITAVDEEEEDEDDDVEITRKNVRDLAPKFKKIYDLIERAGRDADSMRPSESKSGDSKCPGVPGGYRPSAAAADDDEDGPDTAGASGGIMTTGKGIVLVAFGYNRSTSRFCEFLRNCGYAELDSMRDIKKKKRADYRSFTTLGKGSTELERLLAVVNADDNWDGRRIRVVVAMPRFLTGVDFKNVRQVHIAEPWWNNGRNEQAIGRAFRRNSHLAFAPANRNVTVYQHALVYTRAQRNILEGEGKHIGTGTMNDDLHNLNVAAAKARDSAAVLDALRAAAVDCALQQKRTNDDYALAQRKAYSNIVDVFGNVRIAASSHSTVGKKVSCEMNRPRYTVSNADARGVRVLRDELRDVIDDTIDVISGVFRVFETIASDHLYAYVKKLAQSAILGRHAAVQYHPAEMIRIAVEKMIKDGIRVIAPCGRSGTIVLEGGNYVTTNFMNGGDEGTAHTVATRAVRRMDWLLQPAVTESMNARSIRAFRNRTSDLWERCKVLRIMHASRGDLDRLLRACVDYVFMRTPASQHRAIVKWVNTLPSSPSPPSDETAAAPVMRAIQNHYKQMSARGKEFTVYRSTHSKDSSQIRYIWDIPHATLIEIGTIHDSKQFRPPEWTSAGDGRSVAYLKFRTTKSDTEPSLVLRTRLNPTTNGIYATTKRKDIGAPDFVKKYIAIFGKQTRNRNAAAVEVAMRAGLFDEEVKFYRRGDTYK